MRRIFFAEKHGAGGTTMKNTWAAHSSQMSTIEVLGLLGLLS